MATLVQSYAKQDWLRLQKRSLPIVLLLVLLGLALSFISQAVSSESFELRWNLSNTVVLIDTFLLPLVAVNSVFLLQRVLQGGNRNAIVMIVLKLLAAMLGVSLASMVLEQVYASMGYIDDDVLKFGGRTYSPATSNVITNTLLVPVFGLPILIMQHRVEVLARRLHEKEMQQERTERLKTEAELHALQAAINPHFLFNALNSVASLIATEPDKAEKMVVQLSALFRHSVNSRKTTFNTLEAELEVVDIYLGIEKVRFGDRLQYSVEMDKELGKTQLPRLFLQPLVENAIKHGIAKVRKGVLKMVINKETDEYISIRIYDNGPAFPQSLEPGYGLESTLSRLEMLYPNGHHLEMVNGDNKHLLIKLKRNGNSH